ncbi:methylglutaconyl-CoA hydratase, mitochondrial-like [Ciona intestinalis]
MIMFCRNKLLRDVATLSFRNHKVSISKPFSTTLCLKTDEELVTTHLDGDLTGITILGINRPQSRNSIGKNLSRMLIETVDELKYDPNIRVLIVRSMVPGIFCAGADLKERRTMKEKCPAMQAYRSYIFIYFKTKPFNHFFVFTEKKLIAQYFCCCTGGTQNLARVVGPSIAKELIYTARVIDGNEAHRIGLVNHIVPQNENGDAAFTKSLELAKEIVPQGPIALRMAKQAINRGSEVDLSSGLAFEQACYAQVIPTKDRLEGLTAFKEKRKPNYKGH